MTVSPAVPLVARKTITTIQDGSVYKDRYPLPSEAPSGTTARQEWRDSAGAVIAEITGTVSGRYITFESPYADVADVPNGAGFYCYMHLPTDSSGVEHMVRYGNTFRRELSYPNSPAIATEALVRQFEDTFQRPAGPVGGRWKMLQGKAKIYSNDSLGVNKPNTVGPDHAFYSRYFMRYYQPFNNDAIELSLSVIDKGAGVTIIAINSAADASSYLYVGFRSRAWPNLAPPGELGLLTPRQNVVELGYGTDPDIGATDGNGANIFPQIEPVQVYVTYNSLSQFRVRYNDVTKTISVHNSDLSQQYCSWTDTANYVPHGRGYRYFGIGGRSGATNAGVQVAYIRAQDAV